MSKKDPTVSKNRFLEALALRPSPWDRGLSWECTSPDRPEGPRDPHGSKAPAWPPAARPPGPLCPAASVGPCPPSGAGAVTPSSRLVSGASSLGLRTAASACFSACPETRPDTCRVPGGELLAGLAGTCTAASSGHLVPALRAALRWPHARSGLRVGTRWLPPHASALGRAACTLARRAPRVRHVSPSSPRLSSLGPPTGCVGRWGRAPARLPSRPTSRRPFCPLGKMNGGLPPATLCQARSRRVNAFTLTRKLCDLSAGLPSRRAWPPKAQPIRVRAHTLVTATRKTTEAPPMTDKCVLLATAQKRLTCTNNKKAKLVTVGPKTKRPVTSLVGKLANNVLFLDKWVTAPSHQSFLTF